jgi:hypothetical protein
MKITISIPTRNDNYGGNLIETATYCLQTMSKTFEEIIVVDFGSASPIYSILNQTISEKKGNIRVITVPKTWVAEKFPGRTMADVIARNIGIRRANNDVIASSNIDIIPAILNRFDFSKFDQGMFYSSNKFMIEHNMVKTLRGQGMSWESIQEYLFITKNQYFRQPDHLADPWSKVSGCGDFQIGHRNIWFDKEVRGFEETLVYMDYADSNLHKKIIENAHREVRPAHFFYVFHQSHLNNRENVQSNSPNTALHKFTKTTNPETWGFSNEKFEEFSI